MLLKSPSFYRTSIVFLADYDGLDKVKDVHIHLLLIWNKVFGASPVLTNYMWAQCIGSSLGQLFYVDRWRLDQEDEICELVVKNMDKAVVILDRYQFFDSFSYELKFQY